MSWKIVIFGFITLFLLCSFGHGEEVKRVSPEQFSKKLKQMIIGNDVAGYNRLHTGECMKGNGNPKSPDVIMEEDYASYIFGVDQELFSIRHFLLEDDRAVFMDHVDGTDEYVVIFYDSQKMSFPNTSTQKDMEQHWGENYVNTPVEFFKGKWCFKCASFYFPHFLWSEDYG